MGFVASRWQRTASMRSLRLRILRLSLVACLGFGAALPAAASASPDPGYPSGPPYAPAGRLDADEACEGGLYDIVVRNGNRYARCLAGDVAAQRFSAATAVSGSTATLTLTRVSGGGTPSLVGFATEPGTATAGTDYTAMTGELFFAEGVTTRTLTIPVVRDAQATADRRFSVRLSAPIGLGQALPDDVTVTIPGPPVPPTITSGPSGEQLLHQATFGFSGVGGASFDCRLDEAAFAPCTSPRSYTTLPAGERRFEVRQQVAGGPWSTSAVREWTVLPSPDPGYPDGPPYAPSGRPIDGDHYCDGGFYSLPTYNGDRYLWCLGSLGVYPWQRLSAGTVVGEDTATVTISRLEAGVPLVVGFATEADTAVADRDFTPARGELYFAANATSRTLTIPITRDSAAGEPRRFSLKLTEPVRQGLGLPEIDVTIPGHPPTASTPPTVGGTARVGHELTSTDGEWTHQPTSVARSWERCDATGSGCVAIEGADETSYEPVAADVGSRLRITVTVANGSGSISGSSSASAVVRSALGAPTITAGPSGSQILHRATFGFSGESGATFECRLDGGMYETCTSPRTLTQLPAGERRFEVRQRATDGALSEPAVREWTVLPSPDPGYPLAPPYGFAIDAFSSCGGGEFSLVVHNNDRWARCAGDPGALAWQRFAADVEVDGNAATVTVTRDGSGGPALIGFATSDGTAVAGELFFAPGVTSRTLEIPVVRDPGAGSDRSFTVQLRDVLDLNLRVEDATVRIPGNPPTVVDVPAVIGTARTGAELRATDGAWTHDPSTFAFAWLRCDADGERCAPIAGATEDTYRLVDGDVGHRLRVALTATNGAGSAEARSAATAVIEAAAVPPGPEPGGDPGPGPPPGTPPGNDPPTEAVPPPAGPDRRPSTPPAAAKLPVRMTTVRLELRFCRGCTTLSAQDRKRLRRLRGRVDGSRLLAIDGYGDRGRSRAANRKLARARVRAVERVLVSGVKHRPARRAVVAHDRLVRAAASPAAGDTKRGGRPAERIVTVRVVNRR